MPADSSCATVEAGLMTRSCGTVTYRAMWIFQQNWPRGPLALQAVIRALGSDRLSPECSWHCKVLFSCTELTAKVKKKQPKNPPNQTKTKHKKRSIVFASDKTDWRSKCKYIPSYYANLLICMSFSNRLARAAWKLSEIICPSWLWGQVFLFLFVSFSCTTGTSHTLGNNSASALSPRACVFQN